MAVEQAPTFTAEDLLKHIHYVADTIGPRPAGSREERLTADYVRRVLADAGIEDVEEQRFTTHDSVGWRSLPYIVMVILLVPIGWFAGRVAKLFAGIGLIGSAFGLRDVLLSKPAPFQDLINKATSHNVIARIEPRGTIERRLVLVAHLDSQKVRYTFPREPHELNKPLNTAGIGLTGLAGLSMAWDALTGEDRIRWWQVLALLMGAASLVEGMRDEMQPHVDGANDNASALSVLLELAKQLHEQPLERTEVVLLFSGSEEVGCTGMEHFLQTHPYDPANTFFIDLEMVGTGQIGYARQHGMSHLSEYVPGPRMTALTQQVANVHGLRGYDMLMVEELAVIDRYGYDGVCVVGVDQHGRLPNWHRPTDTTRHIEADTLLQAASFVTALVHEVDTRTHIP